MTENLMELAKARHVNEYDAEIKNMIDRAARAQDIEIFKDTNYFFQRFSNGICVVFQNITAGEREDDFSDQGLHPFDDDHTFEHDGLTFRFTAHNM